MPLVLMQPYAVGVTASFHRGSPREVKNLPGVNQIVRTELGFKLDSQERAISRMTLPTLGSCVFHKNS